LPGRPNDILSSIEKPTVSNSIATSIIKYDHLLLLKTSKICAGISFSCPFNKYIFGFKVKSSYLLRILFSSFSHSSSYRMCPFCKRSCVLHNVSFSSNASFPPTLISLSIVESLLSTTSKSFKINSVLMFLFLRVDLYYLVY